MLVSSLDVMVAVQFVTEFLTYSTIAYDSYSASMQAKDQGASLCYILLQLFI